VHAGLAGFAMTEGALVDAHFEAPLVVDAHHADDRQVQPRGGLQLGNVEQEGGIAGGEQHRALAAVGDRGADRVGQAGAQMTEVLVPDDVVRLALQVGPLKITVPPPSRT
jgi:hypothetical protein